MLEIQRRSTLESEQLSNTQILFFDAIIFTDCISQDLFYDDNYIYDLVYFKCDIRHLESIINRLIYI